MTLLDTHIDVAANKTLLFEQNMPFFVILIYSAFLDAVSTIHFMNKIGPYYETNFFVRHLSCTLGIFIGPVIGKLLQILAVWIISVFTPHLTRFICIVIFIVNVYAFISNMCI